MSRVNTQERVDFRNRLRAAMQLRGVTGVELAKRVGLTESAVSRWFTADNMPGGQVMARLAPALNVSSTWLLMGQGGPEGQVLPAKDPDVEALLRVAALQVIGELRACLDEVQQRYENQATGGSAVERAIEKAAERLLAGRQG